jgi:hypothetical protein
MDFDNLVTVVEFRTPAASMRPYFVVVSMVLFIAPRSLAILLNYTTLFSLYDQKDYCFQKADNLTDPSVSQMLIASLSLEAHVKAFNYINSTPTELVKGMVILNECWLSEKAKNTHSTLPLELDFFKEFTLKIKTEKTVKIGKDSYESKDLLRHIHTALYHHGMLSSSIYDDCAEFREKFNLLMDSLTVIFQQVLFPDISLRTRFTVPKLLPLNSVASSNIQIDPKQLTCLKVARSNDESPFFHQVLRLNPPKNRAHLSLMKYNEYLKNFTENHLKIASVIEDSLASVLLCYKKFLDAPKLPPDTLPFQDFHYELAISGALVPSPIVPLGIDDDTRIRVIFVILQMTLVQFKAHQKRLETEDVFCEINTPMLELLQILLRETKILKKFIPILNKCRIFEFFMKELDNYYSNLKEMSKNLPKVEFHQIVLPKYVPNFNFRNFFAPGLTFHFINDFEFNQFFSKKVHELMQVYFEYPAKDRPSPMECLSPLKIKTRYFLQRRGFNALNITLIIKTLELIGFFLWDKGRVFGNLSSHEEKAALMASINVEPLPTEEGMGTIETVCLQIYNELNFFIKGPLYEDKKIYSSMELSPFLSLKPATPVKSNQI